MFSPLHREDDASAYVYHYASDHTETEALACTLAGTDRECSFPLRPLCTTVVMILRSRSLALWRCRLRESLDISPPSCLTSNRSIIHYREFVGV